MIEFLSNYWYYIVIYLSGCLVNYLLCKDHFETKNDGDDGVGSLIASMMLLPFYMLDLMACMFFIAFSWIGTLIWVIVQIIEKIKK